MLARSLNFPIFYSNDEYLEFTKYVINHNVLLDIFPHELCYEYLRDSSKMSF